MTKDTIYLSDCTPEGANRVDDAKERARADCERPRGVRQQATGNHAVGKAGEGAEGNPERV